MHTIVYLVLLILLAFIVIFGGLYLLKLELLPPYFTNISMWMNIVSIFFMAALIAILLALLDRREETKQLDSFVLLFSFSTLGLVTGELAGFSEEPVLGAVLPAVLSLVGGLAIYMVGRGEVKEGRAIIALCVLGLAGSLLIGTHSGVVLKEFRNETRQVAKNAENKISDFEIMIEQWDK